MAGGGTKDEDGSPATEALLWDATGIAVDGAGTTLYIAQYRTGRVRVVSNGVIRTLAGGGEQDGDGAAGARSRLYGPLWVACDQSGRVFVSELGRGRVRMVEAGGAITDVAGRAPQGVAADSPGNLYIADWSPGSLLKVAPPPGGKVSDAATGLLCPRGVAANSTGDVYFTDETDHLVRKLSATGSLAVVAGGGTAYRDGDLATRSALENPTGLGLDAWGNLYISEGTAGRVRRVGADGIITTVVRSTAADGTSPTAEPGLLAHFRPFGLAVDGDGNLYVSDTGAGRVLCVEAAHRIPVPDPGATDLYPELVSPVTVPRGKVFDLGARLRNRGPATVDGARVKAALVLPEGLVSDGKTTTRRCERTFPGQSLKPHQGFLDAVFKIHAEPSARADTYIARLTVDHGGEKESHWLPVTVSTPVCDATELALTVYQVNIPDTRPGGDTAFRIELVGRAFQAVVPGPIDQTFTAPSGFVFTDSPATFGYYGAPGHVAPGLLKTRLLDGGRVLTVTGNPHVNSAPNGSDRSPLIYTLPARALGDAAPGTSTDGRARIGRLGPVPLAGSIGPSGQTAVAHLHTYPDEAGQSARSGQIFPRTLHVRALDGKNPGYAVPGALIRLTVLAPNLTGSTFLPATGPKDYVEVRTGPDGVATAPDLLAGRMPGDVVVYVTAPETPEAEARTVKLTVTVGA